MPEAYRIFISCVTREFGSYRVELRKGLTTQNMEVKVQEDFKNLGRPLLVMLDEYIRQCTLVVQLVGDMCGGAPQANEVETILQYYPDFESLMPKAVIEHLKLDLRHFTYTQWEGLLATFHYQRSLRRPRLFKLLAGPGSKRDPLYVSDTAQRATQTAYVDLLKTLGGQREELDFANAMVVENKVLGSLIGEPLPEPFVTAGVVTWPTVPDHFKPDIADRRDEFDYFKQFISGATPKRFYFLKGPSNMGKSELYRVFMMAAKHLTGLRCAGGSFQGTVSLDDILRGMLDQLIGLGGFARTASIREVFMEQLMSLGGPVFLAIDCFDQATPEARDWIEGTLLPKAELHGGIRVVLTGQLVPQGGAHAPWSWFCTEHVLQPITNKEDWRQFAIEHNGCTEEGAAHVLAFAHSGNHGLLKQLISLSKPQ